MRRPISRASRRRAAGLGLVALALTNGRPAAAEEPLRIGVIAEASAISGAAIPRGAQMAAEEINQAGGVNGRKIALVTYDDHNSATDAVRAFQRAANQDKVAAVIGSYLSEVALALEPWAARLHVPYVATGASSNEISRRVHEDYARLRYTFHGYLTSGFLAQSVCDAGRALLADGLHVKTAVIMSEDAAWTTPLDAGYQECLPKIGIRVLDHIRFSPDTTDFTPIYNKIEGEKPDVIITGISHVGVQPTVQWQAQQVPVPMFGISSQATSSTFWKDTNGAAEGVMLQVTNAPGVRTSPTSEPFTEAYTKRFGVTPAYTGYGAYDEIHYIAEAVRRAGSTDPEKLVAALEQTDYQGTMGHIGFYGEKDPATHAIKYGPGFVTGLLVQWHDGRQVALWPHDIATGTMTFPSFIKANQAAR